MLLAQHGQMQLQNNKRYSVNSLIQCGLLQLQQVCTQIGKIHATSIQKIHQFQAQAGQCQNTIVANYTGIQNQNYSCFMGF